MVKNSPDNVGDIRDVGSIPDSGQSPGGGVLAWRNPWTEEPSRLWFIGSETVGHD